MENIIETLQSVKSKYSVLSLNSVILVAIFMMTVLVYRYLKAKTRPKSNEYWQKKLVEFSPSDICHDPLSVYTDEVLRQRQKLIVANRVNLHIESLEEKKYFNLVCANYLNLLGNDDVTERTMDIVRKYGVGSCGPRGFYGTVDVHLDLETRIARFMKMEEAIVYSYGYSTVASTIPAYCKHRDVIFCDVKISQAARMGLLASRSKVYFFRHNDAQDLEKLIIQHGLHKPRNKAERTFILVEGIYESTGYICDLVNIVEVRRKYGLRLFLDESNSIGVLGKTGRGVMEHLNIDADDVDLVVGSLETLIGSVGGFCVGSHFTIEHQRLSGLGYCFSASLPPLLAYAAICSFDYMADNSPKIFTNLRKVCISFHGWLKKLPNVEIFGAEESPLKFFEFRGDNKQRDTIYYELERALLDENIIVKYEHQVSPDVNIRHSIKMHVNAALTEDDMEEIYEALNKCIIKLVDKYSTIPISTDSETLIIESSHNLTI